MTLPYERTRALVFARQLLTDLLDPKKTPRIPRDIRSRAQHALRHYPTFYEVLSIAQNEVGGANLRGAFLDVDTARQAGRHCAIEVKSIADE